MSPIYVRPAREQSEHDRLIRHLQTKYKSKKFEIAANIDGVDPVTSVKIGLATLAPDLVFIEGKKLVGLVEVETGESVNNLEAMAQWVHFSHARVPFHLYVPVHGYEAARRLCDSYGARVGEIWTYRPTHDGFDLVRMHVDAAAASGQRGVKAVPVSIVIPVVPKPVPKPVEVPEPPKPAIPAKIAAPVPAKAPVKAPAPPAKPVPAPAAAKPVAKPLAKPAPKSVAKPAPKPSKPQAKPAKAGTRPPAAKPTAKAGKAKPAKVVAKPSKSKATVKGTTTGKASGKANGKKSSAGRGKKPALRKGR